MHRLISPFAAALFVVLVGALASGCDRPVNSCSEFDPPPGKEPTACPPKPAAAIQAQPAQPARYCYATLAQADCYTEPQPGRTGYLGSTEALAPAASGVPTSKAKPANGSTAAAAHGHDSSSAAAAPPASPAAPAPAAPAAPAPAAPATGAPTPLAPPAPAPSN